MENTEPTRPQSPSDRAFGCFKLLVAVPLTVVGGLVTVFWGFLTIAYVGSRIKGGPPEPNFLSTEILWLILGFAPLALGMFVLNGPSKPVVSRRILIGLWLILMVVTADAMFGPRNWHRAFNVQKTVRGNASDFKATYVTPHLDVALARGTNLLWCGTFQMAWDEACALTGGNLQLASADNASAAAQNAMAAALNRHAFGKDCVDDASYVAMAGLVKDRIHEKICNEVKHKLKFEPRLIPDKSLTQRPQDLVAYAALLKNLSFPVPFERLDDALHFDGKPVRAFGLGRTQASHEAMRPQVLILDYQNEENFVVELKTTNKADRLILARLEPQGTLAEMIGGLQNRLSNREGEIAGTNDVLMVPRMKFDLIREFSEIEGCRLVSANANIAKDLFLLSAMQSIEFDLNEKGVDLKSEAHMAFGCGKSPEPARQHIMIFNKPFLLILQRTGARMPYFAMWVDNPELLASW